MIENKAHIAKKHFGQNFLKSVPALKKIVAAGEINSQDVILEIGPGKGVLTAQLLAEAGKVVAVEKDRDLIELLKEKFEKEIKAKKLILMEGDVLEFEGDMLANYKIIANIPYNITGAILKKFLSAKNQPERMILLVQHEVAKRIVAKDGKESILSISVKAYGQPKLIGKVEARYFSPAPKVDSAIIAIKNISREFFNTNKINEEKFWEIVKKGFAHKRKKLSGNLKSELKSKNNLPLELKDKRAENLSLNDWIVLVK